MRAWQSWPLLQGFAPPPRSNPTTPRSASLLSPTTRLQGILGSGSWPALRQRCYHIGFVSFNLCFIGGGMCLGGVLMLCIITGQSNPGDYANLLDAVIQETTQSGKVSERFVPSSVSSLSHRRWSSLQCAPIHRSTASFWESRWRPWLGCASGSQTSCLRAACRWPA